MGYLMGSMFRGLGQAFTAVLLLCLILELAESSATGKRVVKTSGVSSEAKRKQKNPSRIALQCQSYCRKANALNTFPEPRNEPAWNYVPGDPSGPDNWSRLYPKCGGLMQSPINIKTSRVVYDRTLSLFDFSDYSNKDGVNMTLTNLGGHTAELMVSGTSLFLNGGNLPEKYKLVQMHFHWGCNDTRGSEHSVDGKFFPLEIHIVHRQNSQPSVEEAAKSPFGLAVVAIFVTSGSENIKFNQLVDFLDRIPNPNDEVEVPAFALLDLIPERYDFYRYYGSLTTPPCYESVIWSIGTDPIQMSEQQLNKFRALLNEKHNHLVDDFRPTQPLNWRTVTTTKEPSQK